MKRTLVYLSISVTLCVCPTLQVTPCWSTTGWSSPPKTGTTTTRRTTAPPSTTAPGGTATATPQTSTASTCAGSTPPTPMALSGPPGPAGSTRSSFPRWRFGPPVIRKTNELHSLVLASWHPCLILFVDLNIPLWPLWLAPQMILFLLLFFYCPATCSVLVSIIHLWPLFSLRIMLPSSFSLAFGS